MTKIDSFFASEGPLSACLSEYVPRSAQIEMAQAIVDILPKKQGRLVVEAGTGTGKSLAYLSAALLSGRAVLISTATKTLQEQLFYKDLPLALKAFGKPRRTLLMKGRSNYLCLLKARDFAPSEDLLDRRENKIVDSLKVWIEKTQTGDRAELTELAEDSHWWQDLNASPESCVGQTCPFYSDCFVTRLRRQALQADILVVNHALLCADQRNDDTFGRVLPKMDLWVLDEAHALEDIATRSFGFEITGRQIRYLMRDLREAVDDIDQGDQVRYQEAVDNLLPLFLKIDLTGYNEDLERCLGLIEICLGSTKKQDILTRRVMKLSGDLRFMLSGPEGFIVFKEQDQRGLILSAAPIEPAEVLKKTLWEVEHPVILTSATLAVNNSLESFQKRLGLESDSEGLILKAPFDTLNQSALYIPPEPSNIESEIKKLLVLSRGGTFLLFTSHRALNSTYESLRDYCELQGLEVLKQGDMPKLELIRRFVEADRHFGAVLFATNSFWEGVDVQGRALRLVVIDRLPFRSPEEPIHKARCASLEKRGENSFRELSLPQAALALKQGVGRLLRTHTDRGVVAILDPRVQEKSYGRIFLNTLPPMTQVQDFDQLKTFLS